MKRLPLLIVCLAVTSVIAGEAPPAGEAVKLEYKLQPGMELRYATEGSYKQPGGRRGAAYESKYTGSVRIVVCEVDAKSGVMLLGRLLTMATSAGTGKGKLQERTERMVFVSRMDRCGKNVPRETPAKEKESPQQNMARTMLGQLDSATLMLAALSSAPVKTGDNWDSDGHLAMYPVKCKCSSSVAELKQVEGRRHAVIKSKMTPGAGGDAPQLNGSGEEELLFDVERGLPVESKEKAEMSYGRGMGMTIEVSYKLEAVRTLPAEELAASVTRFKALDGAIAMLYAGETDKGLEELEKLRAAEKEAEWQAGFEQLVSMGQNIKEYGSRGEALNQEAQTPEQKAYTEAAALADDGKWKEAAAGYRAFAEKNPEHKLAPQALLAAAAIYEGNLDDKASAAQMRKTLVALREKSAAKEGAKDPLELYKLASGCAAAGEDQKALEAYRKFLAGDCRDVRMRVLATYRVAGLVEKQCEKKLATKIEVLEAYKAVDAIQTDDDYAKKLKEKAKEKVKELGGK